MRKVAHFIAYFKEQDKETVLSLMQEQCSASRSAHQAIHKHKLRGNDVKNYVKRNYMESLNQRYVADAVTEASKVRHEKALFGGKKAWKELQTGNLSKEEWRQRRNNRLYSRGDRTKKGNPNIRIEGQLLLVNDPSERRRWIQGQIYLPKKFNPDWSCYGARLIYRNGNFYGTVSWDEGEPQKIETVEGAVGIDCNPDGVALSEVDGSGNLLHQRYERSDRLRYSRRNKRDADCYEIAREVVDYALDRKKPIVVERLSFSKNKKGRKFNRMSHNFVYRKLLSSISSRAARCGVPVIQVNPAFTSILGKLKYQDMYSLSTHNAAAMVIARRGMGILERQTFTVTLDEKKKVKLNPEGRDITIALTQKAYSWLQDCFLKPKEATLTESLLAPTDVGIGKSVGETPASESCRTTSQTGERLIFQRMMKGILLKLVRFSNFRKPG